VRDKVQNKLSKKQYRGRGELAETTRLRRDADVDGAVR